MKVVKQSFEILDEFDRSKILRKLELAGRTCYKSEDKITDESASKFISSLVTRGHESVLEHVSISVKFITNRGVTHELVRHRLASYSQESSRYCNYGKEKFGKEITVVYPEFAGTPDECWTQNTIWHKAMKEAEANYFSLLELSSTEYARGVLPNDLKTEIVMTANLREWRHIFKVRCAPAAHPHIRSLLIPLRDKFFEELPEVFGYYNDKKD
jgi:thymidylate synthase (FAD)